MVEGRRVGVLGASSLVAGWLLGRLADAGREAVAYSRRPRDGTVRPLTALPGAAVADTEAIALWVSLLPLPALPPLLPRLAAGGARKLVALSSTSRLTKADSTDPHERAVAASLAQAESQVLDWARSAGVAVTLLRPTLIYGGGADRNVSALARLIRRYRVVPLVGSGGGLRQPVHAADVAAACVAALGSEAAPGRTYAIPGAEPLTYRAMLERIFVALEMRPRFVPVPRAAFRLLLPILRARSGERSWNLAMVERMNRDMAFDYAEAARDLGYAPRPFRLTRADLPPC